MAAGKGANREVYIDAFRGVMALVMVQGHLCDALLQPAIRATPFYRFETIFHGSTAPGFLFASGFVAGLPRAPLSLKAALRRARRLLFILGVGYVLHLPYFSFFKTLAATPAEKGALFACDALQVIAVTQLFAVAFQAAAGKRWPAIAGVLAVVVLALGPWVWTAHLGDRLPAFLSAYLDNRTGSIFPVFPFSAFVLAGSVAGAALGRQEPAVRHARMLRWGVGLLGVGGVLALLLDAWVDYWTVSPAYALVRLGGLLLLLRLVAAAADRSLRGIGFLALLGRETLLVFVLHLYLLFGGITGPAPLLPLAGHLGLAEAALVLILMLPVLYAAAWLWRRAKAYAPREATLALVFLAVAFLYEFAARPW